MPRHVVMDANSGHFFCQHCGAAEPAPVNVLLTDMVAKMRAFTDAHADCPQPRVYPPPPIPDRELPVPAEDLAPWPGLEHWLRHGRVGASSKTLAAAITGLPLVDYTSTPADPSDFVRCVVLLNHVPNLRPLLHAPATAERLGPAWAPILAAWADLEARVTDVDDLTVYERLRRWWDAAQPA